MLTGIDDTLEVKCWGYAAYSLVKQTVLNVNKQQIIDGEILEE